MKASSMTQICCILNVSSSRQSPWLHDACVMQSCFAVYIHLHVNMLWYGMFSFKFKHIFLSQQYIIGLGYKVEFLITVYVNRRWGRTLTIILSIFMPPFEMEVHSSREKSSSEYLVL